MERSDGLAEGSRAGAGPGYVPTPGVIVTDLGEELVLLDSTSGEMYTLAGTGRLAWSVLRDGEAAAVAALVAAYEVEPERAAADVGALVRDLLRAGLIVERPVGDAAP